MTYRSRRFAYHACAVCLLWMLATNSVVAQGADVNKRLAGLEAQLTQLQQTLDALEEQMGSILESSAANADEGAGLTATEFNDVQEILRQLRGKNDELIVRYNGLVARLDTTAKDNEFRFQQLETGIRRATGGISSTSAEPEIIGRIKKKIAVEGEDASASAASDVKLVGEGDMPDDGKSVRPPLKKPKALYERALNDLRKGRYRLAESDFIAFVRIFPKHKLVGNAQYWLGESYYVRKQYKRAAEAFLTGYSKYAKSEKAPDSLLKLGMSLSALGERKTGCDAFAELKQKFPNASKAVKRRAKIEKKRAGCRA